MVLNRVFDVLKFGFGVAFLVSRFDTGFFALCFWLLALVIVGFAGYRLAAEKWLMEVGETFYERPELFGRLVAWHRWLDWVKIVFGVLFLALTGFKPDGNFADVLFMAVAAVIAGAAGLRVFNGFYLVSKDRGGV